MWLWLIMVDLVEIILDKMNLGIDTTTGCLLLAMISLIIAIIILVLFKYFGGHPAPVM